MPAPTYIAVAENKLWELLLGNATLAGTFRAGNRVNYQSGKKWPEKTSRGAGDYPEIQLAVESSRVTKANAMPTFGNVRGSGCDRVVEQEVVFKFTATYDGVDETIPNQVRDAIPEALLPDPSLGLSFVKESGAFRHKARQTTQGTAAGTKRLVDEYQFPVLFSLRRSDL